MARKINAEFIKKGAARIKEADFIKVVKRSAKITGKFGKNKSFVTYFEDVKLLIEMVKDYKSGAYRQVPYWAVTAVVFTLLYLSNPFDIIPDFIPILGLTDDIAIISVCLILIERELKAYREWKTGNSA